jgi:prolyl oligopeptidase
MAAVALTRRPDLWAAVCSLVPVTDMLRYHLSPYGETGLREYGDPDAPGAAAVLRAYSPYHNVRPGITYPPTLVVAGANDMRCPAWHARKLVARLQAEAAGGPFLLRVAGGGHLSTRRGVDLVAEWQGFLLRALGLSESAAA